MGTARLVTASATTGWTDWIYGRLWLLDDGLLRVRADLVTTLRLWDGPTVFGREPVVGELSRTEAEAEAARHRRNVWVPREQIVSAVLRGGLLTDSLRLRLSDGRTVRLLWLRRDAAYGPIREVLEGWLGSGLEIRGRRRIPDPPGPPAPRSRARRALIFIANFAVVALIVALNAGWLDPLLDRAGAGTAGGCDTLATFTGDRPGTPEPGSEAHPWASRSSQTAVDRALQPLLLETVDHGSFVHTHEHFWNLDGHAEQQHNPAAREIAVAHGFVRQVSRQWTDEEGRAIVHVITQLSSPTNAAAFDLELARYSCRFADDVRPVRFEHGGPPGIGQRIRHQGGSVTAQVSWIRDGRRHLLSIHDPAGDPDQMLLERLMARAYPHDEGADLVSDLFENGS